MTLTPLEIEKIRQATGRPSLNNTSNISAFDKILADAPSVATTPTDPPTLKTSNLGEETAVEMQAGGQKIVDSVTRASDKFNQAGDIFDDNGLTNLTKKVSALSEGALGTASGAVQTIFAPITATIKKITDKFGDSKTVQEFANTGPVKAWLDSANATLEPLQRLSESHPEAARNIADALNIGLAILGEKAPKLKTSIGDALGETVSGIKSDATSVVNKAKEINSQLGKEVTDINNKKAIDEAIEVTKPVLNKKEAIAAFEKAGMKGGIAEKGALNKYAKEPTARDIEVANSVKGIVSKNKGPVDNIVSINEEIGKIADQELKPFLEKNKVPTNFEDFRKYMTDRISPDSSLKADTEAYSTYKRVTESIINKTYGELKNASKKSGDFTSATDGNIYWDARKVIDNVIEKELGTATFDSPQYMGIRAAAKDARDTFGKFLSDSLANPAQMEKLNKMQEFILESKRRGIEIAPESIPKLEEQFGIKRTPDDLARAKFFTDRMKNLNLMYEARGNVAEANYKLLDKNALQRWIKQNPSKAKLFKAGLGLTGGLGIFKYITD